ncbi:hypothetical protein LINGRAHAP2_LOCUS5287 [Linum grandiflorum]
MGNCCRGASRAAVWAGDDWESVDQHYKVLFDADDRNRLLPEADSSSSSRREVKIKISTRELQELMLRAEQHGLSSEQVLARLISSAESHGNSSSLFHDLLQADLHHRHWKPALQSIPEI